MTVTELNLLRPFLLARRLPGVPVVVIGHNDDPVVKGAGSAVFVHVAHTDWSPTAGCIAFRREDLLTILAQVTTGDDVVIAAA